jgi:F0F1-type ATP synthase assembly protein I
MGNTEHFKNSGWPLLIVLLLTLGFAGGIAVSCSSSGEKENKKQSEKKGETQRESNRTAQMNQSNLDEASFTELSSNFVSRVINGLSVDKHLDIFKNANPDSLDDALDTPRKRLTFWINIYNGYTQYFLKTDPSLYKKNRNEFFSKAQIPIAGYDVSMENVEHGVLRKGSTIWSKGYVRVRAFREDFVQQFAVETVDYRIHFALNCGAKSCPPVVVYEADSVAEQLNENTSYYLNKEVEYNKEKDVVKVPALMNWFSADFGGSDEEKRAILKEYDVIPQDVSPKVAYLPYDWTVKIENYKSYSK